MKLSKIFAVVTLVLTVVSCGSKSSNTPSSSGASGSGGGGGPFTMAQVAGHMTACLGPINNPGDALDGYSYLVFLQLNSDGTFDYEVAYYSASGCQLGSGNEAFASDQRGTYTIDGTTNTPTGASKMTFTFNQGIYVTVYGGNGAGAQWANYFNNYCSGGSPGFNTSATSSAYMTGRNCTHGSSPQITLAPFSGPADVSFQAAIYSASSPHALFISPAAIPWEPGSTGGYPNTANLEMDYF